MRNKLRFDRHCQQVQRTSNRFEKKNKTKIDSYFAHFNGLVVRFLLEQVQK